MTHKERMLAVLRGERTEVIPFVPRLDLWYRANKKNGTLPDKYKNASLDDIVDGLGVGYHAIVPDFQDLRSRDDDVDRALGIYRLWFMPYKAILRNVKREVEYDGDITTVRYHTPKGVVQTKVLFDEAMRRAGITVTHIAEHAIKSKNDFDAVGYIFENIEVEPNYGGYKQFQDKVGDRGFAVGYISLAASPIHLIMRELARLDDFYLMNFDCADEMKQLEKQIQVYFDRVFDIVADSPAETILSGANYDSGATPPPVFAEYFTPALAAQAKTLHEKGKFLITHTDGENTGLLEEYVASGIDIADSICPKPMTKLSLKEVRDCFGDKITIWGGIPSVSVLEDSMNNREFGEYMEDIFEQIGKGDHLIFSIADTAPPAMKFERLEVISKMINEFGAIGG